MKTLFRKLLSSEVFLISLFLLPLCLTSCIWEEAAGEGDLPAEDDPALQIAEEPEAPLEMEPEFVPDPEVAPLTIDRTSEVSLLGYHDFAEKPSKNPMVIEVSAFREQMQALKDASIAVISMEDFLAWKRGEKNVPDPSVVLTIDDGWKTVYDLALPVLQEFGYPFTIFLYAKYVDGGGRALTTPMIKKLIESGASIGSHSISHPSPGKVRAMQKRGGERYDKFLLREMADSKAFLEKRFGQPVTTYAYPGGIFTPRMIELNESTVGYGALVTCNPAKCSWDTSRGEVNRYIVHGNDDRNFRRATTFRGSGGSALDIRRITVGAADGTAPEIRLQPANGERIGERRPRISAQLSAYAPIDPASVSMTLQGLGKVDAVFDPLTSTCSYRPVQVLRGKTWRVSVRFQRDGQSKPDVVAWKFEIDPLQHYLSSEE